ncbi:hypothetical protein HZA33_00820 [Candidatus Pacearchaeota archaeon]|nr:hypothetical protein [Candidatus Pacearchaeota archaeon]
MDITNWRTIERPGYFGKKRDEIFEEYDKKYGAGDWRLAWQFGSVIIPRIMALSVYEDGYYEFLKRDKETLDWLTSYKDVWDTAESNVNSGFEYEIQETSNTHIHDISIRRAVARLGREFLGNRLLRVRWKDSEGFRLSPGIVKFHLPEMIVHEEIKDYGGKGIWWFKDTIEDFYQRNKVLQVKS